MRIGLVLSAGGMFGAWQAGAWAELAKVLKPAAIVGASAGALNGWAIAGGCDPEELIGRWLQPSTAELMSLRWPPLPWSLFDPAPMEQLARSMVEQYTAKLPFAAILVEVPALRLRLVREDEITWKHLAASCAVPTAFPPVSIEGKLFVDGGLLGALPLWAAEQLGADRIVALDALPRMPSAVLRWGAQAIQKLAPAKPKCTIEVLRIQPGTRLGSARDAVRWTPENAARWVQMGRDDLKLALCRISGFIV